MPAHSRNYRIRGNDGAVRLIELGQGMDSIHYSEQNDMGKEYQEIDESMQRWIERQRLFFVSTAPLAEEGHINCSPKGLDSLKVLGSRQLVYADTGGSGIETLAHLKENGRIVVMLCAFEGPPKIFRFYGNGRPIEPRHTDFKALAAMFPNAPEIRNLIVIDIDRIRDACGYGVPLYEFKSERDSLKNWCDSKSQQEMLEYRIENNTQSIDGLPGLDFE
jgi:hypothetical protein